MRIKFTGNFKLFRIIKIKKYYKDVRKGSKILTDHVIKWQTKFNVD